MLTRILALDTTTEACSAALSAGGEVVGCWECLPRGHSARILPMVEELFAQAGFGLQALDALAFCRGPGSFTGVRIAAGVAQGLAYAGDLGVVPISTLAVLAEGAYRERGAERVAVAVDARMGEVYWATYWRESEATVLMGDELVAAPDAVPLPEAGKWFGVGSGFDAHGAALSRRLGRRLAGSDAALLPDARHCIPFALAALSRGELASPLEAAPVYLRNRVTG